jgi:peptide/nickel transport system permease protein
MLARIARRIGLGFAVVFGIVTLTFLLIRLAPGDPARLWVGPGAGAAELDAARAALGLDRPLLVQYVTWLLDFVTLDWGTSLADQRRVLAVVGDALPVTLLLTGLSLLVTYAAGIALGAYQALTRRRGADTGITVVTLLFYGMPAYWLAIMLVLVFSYTAARQGWPAWIQLPAMGATSLDADLFSPWGRLVDRLRHLVLPLTTLSLIGVAGLARYARGSVQDVLHAPFVDAARAKGLTGATVARRHVLRNAMLPVVTLLGLSLPALVSGTVFVETIFAWPGMGRVMVNAVTARDYPVVMAITVVFAVLVVIGNLLADVAATAIDPRQREAA